MLYKKFSISSHWRLGCPKITPNLKCLAPDADSGAKFQVLMESDQKNEIDQGLGVPNLIWNFANRFTTMAIWNFFELK